MAQGNDSQRLKDALQSLREARGELTAESKWLRAKLSPARMVHHTVDQHTGGFLFAAFVAGLGGAWLIFHKRFPRSARQSHRAQLERTQQKRAPRTGIGSPLLKAAMPFVLKFATSKPVLQKLLDLAAPRRGRPARHTMGIPWGSRSPQTFQSN